MPSPTASTTRSSPGGSSPTSRFGSPTAANTAVVIHEDRTAIEERLEEVRTEKDAEIRVESVTTLHDGVTAGMFRTNRLLERQREVFELARRRPRAVTAADLADELGIVEATLLKHLRKAKSKLLDPIRSERTRATTYPLYLWWAVNPVVPHDTVIHENDRGEV